MRQIVCDECKKRYDYDKDEFCPRCGAFNQPVKLWTTDGQGNVRRVDGVNEQNHAGSFVHGEVHKEKRVRQARGMDWSGKTKTAPRQPQPVRPAARRPKQQKKRLPEVTRIFLWIVAILIITNFILPLLSLLLRWI
ncbi:MAG: hydrogenase maturation nickel metallochaperone HypA [Oscillibacter sp.]|nr:hydrogenase maturation nickel metallochaperone HypA [Oscillibacter sp.]